MPVPAALGLSLGDRGEIEPGRNLVGVDPVSLLVSHVVAFLDDYDSVVPERDAAIRGRVRNRFATQSRGLKDPLPNQVGIFFRRVLQGRSRGDEGQAREQGGKHGGTSAVSPSWPV